MDDLDRRILEMESRRYRYGGAKVRAIRGELGLGDVAYFARLNRLLDDPEAALAYPQLVSRLRRLRALRVAS